MVCLGGLIDKLGPVGAMERRYAAYSDAARSLGMVVGSATAIYGVVDCHEVEAYDGYGEGESGSWVVVRCRAAATGLFSHAVVRKVRNPRRARWQRRGRLLPRPLLIKPSCWWSRPDSQATRAKTGRFELTRCGLVQRPDDNHYGTINWEILQVTFRHVGGWDGEVTGPQHPCRYLPTISFQIRVAA